MNERVKGQKVGILSSLITCSKPFALKKNFYFVTRCIIYLATVILKLLFLIHLISYNWWKTS